MYYFDKRYWNWLKYNENNVYILRDLLYIMRKINRYRTNCVHNKFRHWFNQSISYIWKHIDVKILKKKKKFESSNVYRFLFFFLFLLKLLDDARLFGIDVGNCRTRLTSYTNYTWIDWYMACSRCLAIEYTVLFVCCNQPIIKLPAEAGTICDYTLKLFEAFAHSL